MSALGSDFQYDVFLSHSAKDKTVVREIAERLRTEGLRVWFDEWILKPGDNIPAKIEEGLDRSRVLVLCMSAQAFGSDWAQLEAGTFRFRDPLNKERRFLPLRLDDAPIKGSLAQFLYINWIPEVREQEYAKLLEACQPPTTMRSASVPQNEVPESAAADANQDSRQAQTTIGDANIGIAVSQAVPPPLGQRPTVWVLGSYSELEIQDVILTRKLVAIFGSSLAARGIRLVSGKSDMLDELAAHCRNVAMSTNPRGPLPIILDGKLRQTDLRTLFHDTIGRIPDLAIVIGGGVGRRRVADECIAAGEATIPVLPVPVTGGAAARVEFTAHKADDLYVTFTRNPSSADMNDLVLALLKAVERYAPNGKIDRGPEHTSVDSDTAAESYSRAAKEPIPSANTHKDGIGIQRMTMWAIAFVLVLFTAGSFIIFFPVQSYPLRKLLFSPFQAVTPMKRSGAALIRPIQPGLSFSHERSNGGTACCVVRDKIGKVYLLSANDIFAPATAKAGDAILQPGIWRGGGAEPHVVARLSKWLPATKQASITTVGAIAEIDPAIGWLADIHGFGPITGIQGATQKGDEVLVIGVEKILRRAVTKPRATLTLNSGAPKTVLEEIVTIDEPNEKDRRYPALEDWGEFSGSPVVSRKGKLIGMVVDFASCVGIPAALGTEMYVIPINRILQRFDVELVTGEQ